MVEHILESTLCYLNCSYMPFLKRDVILGFTLNYFHLWLWWYMDRNRYFVPRLTSFLLLNLLPLQMTAYKVSSTLIMYYSLYI